MVFHYDQEGFYKLPDWKKLTLKRSKPKYRGYRTMTHEQEESRKEAIYHICAHFGMTSVDELEDDVFSTMENFWPNKIELFLTPRLLDLASVEFLTQFGYCSYCVHFNGVKKQKLQSKVIPFKGLCLKSKTEKEIVSHDYRCCGWELEYFHLQRMYWKIDKLLKLTQNYLDTEYLEDLQHFNFWNYFFYIH